MSRIGKLPISIPNGVSITITNGTVNVKGPKGELHFTPHLKMKVQMKDNQILVERPGDTNEDKALHGTTRTLIFNMVTGVTKGFERKLEVNGVGFRVNIQGKKLILNLGFSHPVEVQLPEGIAAELDKEKKNIITLSGTDKQAVSETAARIRRLRPPEPYKGKGIKYLEEVIQRKAGKAVATKTA